jgi:hydroxypyruvate isomerase
MLRFSANITMLFNEVDFLARFEKAARAGFKGIEYLFPYEWGKDQLIDKLGENGLIQVLHNLPVGDWSAGERGIACIPARETEFQEGVGKAIDYAKALGCFQVNCLVGLTPQNVPVEKVRETLIGNLRFAAKALDNEGIHLLIEPVNDRDIPGFYLVHTADALQIIKEVGHPNLWLQYDVYHMQIMEGNLTKTILDNLSTILHIQIADNPGRHEPGTGEINFANLFKAIETAGYDRWVGCEYKPAGRTEDGLQWLSLYR